MKLCSEILFDDIYPVCDLPPGHDGAHEAHIYWGDERGDEDD